MAYAIPTPAQTQTIELSNTIVAGPAQRGMTNINALLVSQTLIAAAKHKAGFIQPRPSAPMRMYTNPDGTITTSREGALAFHHDGFHTAE